MCFFGNIRSLKVDAVHIQFEITRILAFYCPLYHNFSDLCDPLVLRLFGLRVNENDMGRNSHKVTRSQAHRAQPRPVTGGVESPHRRTSLRIFCIGASTRLSPFSSVQFDLSSWLNRKLPKIFPWYEMALLRFLGRGANANSVQFLIACKTTSWINVNMYNLTSILPWYLFLYAEWACPADA